jgi:hypothetical protein
MAHQNECMNKQAEYASVVMAAQPAIGKPVFERWCEVDVSDVRWILRENLRKKRLAAMDQAWVERCLTRLV